MILFNYSLKKSLDIINHYDKKELAKVIKDPSHPFTASLLAALLIILMEATGFGIYMALTWILGTFINDMDDYKSVLLSRNSPSQPGQQVY